MRKQAMLAGWGRYPRHDSELISVGLSTDLPRLLSERAGFIGRGNGRAYGDAAIGEHATLSIRKLDRMQSFDPASGRLTVEAGVLLADILKAFLPRGFFPPVVPGTKLVTVGGMIAADVHGKNHHRDGGFGAHVEELKLVLAGGEMISCSPGRNQALFAATVGGMGLTGVIVEATFRLKTIETGWIMQKTTVAPDLDSAIKALDADDQSTYSVAWIDCLARGRSLGRSLVFAGEHATRDQLFSRGLDKGLLPASPARLCVPFDFPSWTINRASVAAFNEIYFRRGAGKSGDPFPVRWDPYFFPLDGVEDWNRIYGRHGFLQHQSVIPERNAPAVLGEILERVSRSRQAVFMAVLKKLGPGTGILSFPMKGYTAALDFHVSDEIFPLLDEIDRIVVAAGGRLYLAKDARQSRQTFEAGYSLLNEFRHVRRAVHAGTRLESRLSTRLGI